jgi:hypothetical protein
MYYEAKNFQELVEIMASCERLGLLYVVQKDIVEVGQRKFIGFNPKPKFETVWKLQVVQYVEEDDQNENSQGRPSESEEVESEEA